MASLKNRRGNWYARVLWYEEQKKKEKQIPLRTESKVTEKGSQESIRSKMKSLNFITRREVFFP